MTFEHHIGLDSNDVRFVGDHVEMVWLGQNPDGTAWTWGSETAAANVHDEGGSVVAGATVTLEAGGVVRMVLTEAQTTALGPGFHCYVLRVEPVSGEGYTLVHGTLRLKEVC